MLGNVRWILVASLVPELDSHALLAADLLESRQAILIEDTGL